ncbi:Hpt domain-containing protein [Halothiobacillus neapolitanus]|uniref:Chemotaxis protein CheA n=1 Tax=Halothiobacillus neapolitanus (strain ATCC 23641 / DSM 15147 / CIP 104769 / NCIMB 8539 / c2) TaxID=555778 RepID=D0KY49_HALNC|nr:Hpt domain-containing protein [Halothiobacillus neapolitanus]ACX95372.1 CheA signal transduction histidine kinase [Halothiobacillus neapolitanus c2]TDN58359.1 chemosensory pili system protein ChpA (sensor histidine kinase/response regulator) [Halothiobacillus neapolitanus]
MRTESKVDSIVLDRLKEGLNEKIDQLLRALEDLSSGAGGNELVFESLDAVKAIDAVLAVSDYQLLRVMLKEQMSALTQLETNPEKAAVLVTTVTEAAWMLRALLDRLSVGATVNAMSLLPMINRLRQSQGLSEVDTENVLARSTVLWSESRVFVNPYVGQIAAKSEEKTKSNQLLASMEQQILLLMRGDVTAIPGLIETFDRIIEREVNRAVVVATRSFEELLGAVHQDQERYLPLAKRMIGRVLRLFRMEIQGRDSLHIRFEAIEFATDMLLELVRVLPDDSELCGERVSNWHELLSTDGERVRFLGLETSALTQVAQVLSEELNAAQDVLDLFVRGAKSDLEPLVRIQPRLEQIVGVLAALNYEHESGLIQGALEQLIQVTRGSVLFDDDFLMQLAVAIMTTEQVVSQIGHLIVDDSKSLTSVDRVVSEALIPLATACYEDVIASKEAVNMALRPTGQPVAPDTLTNAARLIAGVRNVLEMAELRAAMPLINGLHRWLFLHVNNLQLVRSETISALAEVSAAVEFYLENLRDHQKEMVQFLDGALQMLPVLNGGTEAHEGEQPRETLEPQNHNLDVQTSIDEEPQQPVDESLASMDELIAQLSMPNSDEFVEEAEVATALHGEETAVDAMPLETLDPPEDSDTAPIEAGELQAPELVLDENFVLDVSEETHSGEDADVLSQSAREPETAFLAPDTIEAIPAEEPSTEPMVESVEDNAHLGNFDLIEHQHEAASGEEPAGEASQVKADAEFDLPAAWAAELSLDLEQDEPVFEQKSAETPVAEDEPLPDFETLDLSLPPSEKEPVESTTEWSFLQNASDSDIDLTLPPSDPQSPEHPSFLEEPFNSDLSLDALSLPDIEQAPGRAPESETGMVSDAEVGESSAPSATPEFEETLDELAIEMREVFAEEMQEELPALLEAARTWSNQGGRDHLVTLRRGFHTIKGSSRMVGLTAIGDWGWSYEHLLNQVLDDRVTSTPALRADVLSAVSLMNEALPVLSQGQCPPVSYWQESLGWAEAWSNDQSKDGAASESAITESAPEAETLVAEADVPTVESHEWVQDAPSEVDENILEKFAPSEEILQESEASVTETSYEQEVSSDTDADGEVWHVEMSSMDDDTDTEHPDRSPTVVDETTVLPATEPVSEPEEATAQELTPEPAPVIEDPVLREIFDQESSGYIHQLRQQVDHALINWVSLPCDKELVRLVHTLLGSARTAGVQPIARISNRLEEWIRLLEEHNHSLEHEDLAVFQRSLLMMDRLRQWAIEPAFDQPDEEPIEVEIAARIDQLLVEILSAEPETEESVDEYAEFALPEVVDSAEEETSETIQAVPEASTPLFERSADIGMSVRPDDMPGDQDPDILQIFLEEAEELLEKADGYIAHWRQHPHDLDSIRLLHRNLHTLKGGARMAGLLNLADVTHLLEDRLDRARDRGGEQADVLIALVQHTYDALGKMLDLVRRQAPIPAQINLLAQIANEGSAHAIEALVSDDEALREPVTAQIEEPFAESVFEQSVEAPADGSAVTGSVEMTESAESTAPHAAAVANEVRREQIRVDADRIDDLVNQVGENVLLQARVDRQVNGFERQLFELQQTLTRLRGQLRRLEIQTESQMKAELMAETGLSAEEFDPLEFDRFTQVQELSRGIMESLGDISSIEEAMSDITEQSQLLLLQQSRLGRKLQDGMLALRMVRFNDVVGRLRRIVRQVGDEMGRNAELIIHNGETELDRVTIVGLLPSLEHMIRNSLAHGIESPDERRVLGKPEVGQIEITIESAGGNVTLEMKDDGRGLDLDAIRRKAVERKLIPADIDLSDDEARALIFLPGFSTAGNVSQVAGRGVGMDVVAGSVREMGGFVDLQSEFGKFTRIQLNLPLTQAMTRGILISVGDNQFAIPYKGVVSVTRMTSIQLAEQYASPKPAVTLNGEQYPLFYLGELLRHEPFNANAQEVGVRAVFLFKLGERRFAVQVDHQLGGIQLFVKSLGPQLGRIPGLSGATISDEGNVILVLELFELVRQFQRRDDRHLDLTAQVSVRRRPVVLVVDDSLTVRKVTARTLERNNLDVILARDGVEALGFLHEQKPDVVLTDIEMPRMDGFELLGAIRNDEQTRNVPVIMISSRTGQKHRSRAEALGVSAYLGKPYAEADLIGRIESFITDVRDRTRGSGSALEEGRSIQNNEEQG